MKTTYWILAAMTLTLLPGLIIAAVGRVQHWRDRRRHERAARIIDSVSWEAYDGWPPPDETHGS